MGLLSGLWSSPWSCNRLFLDLLSPCRRGCWSNLKFSFFIAGSAVVFWLLFSDHKCTVIFQKCSEVFAICLLISHETEITNINHIITLIKDDKKKYTHQLMRPLWAHLTAPDPNKLEKKQRKIGTPSSPRSRVPLSRVARLVHLLSRVTWGASSLFWGFQALLALLVQFLGVKHV